MKAAPFEYVRCTTGEQALDALAARPAAATVLAGGQSLLPQLYRRRLEAPLLVDVAQARDLIGVTIDDAAVRIGAATPMADVERSVGEAVPLLARALRLVASPGVRNRGTLGGSAAHADPAAEVPTVLAALDATLTLASHRGVRQVPAGAFYAGRHVTVRRNDELLTQIVLPRCETDEHDVWLELAPRPGDLPIVGVGVRLRIGADGVLANGRLAIGGAATRPQAFALPRWAVGLRPARAPFEELAAELVQKAAFVDDERDQRASARFRRNVAWTLCCRALAAAGEGKAR